MAVLIARCWVCVLIELTLLCAMIQSAPWQTSSKSPGKGPTAAGSGGGGGGACALDASDCAFKPPGNYPLCDDGYGVDCTRYVQCWGSPPPPDDATTLAEGGAPPPQQQGRRSPARAGGTLKSCPEGLWFDPLFGACTTSTATTAATITGQGGGGGACAGLSSKRPEKRRSAGLSKDGDMDNAVEQTPATLTFPTFTTPTTTWPVPDTTTTATTSSPSAGNREGLPTMENATVHCSTATFTCEPGYVWVGDSPQAVHYDVNTMTWGTPGGRCQLAETTDQTPSMIYRVPSSEEGSPFGICLRLQPSAAESSNIVVSLLIGGDALLRFSLNFSCDSAVLASVFDGRELYHIYLSAEEEEDSPSPRSPRVPAPFLNATSTFHLNVLQVAELQSEYEITDGEVTFRGTVDEWPDTSLSVRRVDTLTVTGDAHVILVNTRCVP